MIQGTVDVSEKLTQAEFAKTIDFLIKAFDPETIDASTKGTLGEGLAGRVSEQDLDALRAIRTQHSSNVLNINSFTTDVVDGRVPKLERGSLTLLKA